MSGALMITLDIRPQVSVPEEGEDKGPICPPLPAQYHPATYSTTTPQLHKTVTDYTGWYQC